MKHRKGTAGRSKRGRREDATPARETEHRIRRLIGRKLGVDEARITLRASFIEDLGADSVSLVELTLAFEEEFEIDISDEDADRIRTLADAVDFIEKRTKADNRTLVRPS